jgi:hypothetical protein
MLAMVHFNFSDPIGTVEIVVALLSDHSRSRLTVPVAWFSNADDTKQTHVTKRKRRAMPGASQT